MLCVISSCLLFLPTIQGTSFRYLLTIGLSKQIYFWFSVISLFLKTWIFIFQSLFSLTESLVFFFFFSSNLVCYTTMHTLNFSLIHPLANIYWVPKRCQPTPNTYYLPVLLLPSQWSFILYSVLLSVGSPAVLRVLTLGHMDVFLPVGSYVTLGRLSPFCISISSLVYPKVWCKN